MDSLSGGPGTAAGRRPGAARLAAAASSTELAGARQTLGTAGPSGLPAVSATGEPGRGALAVTFGPGYGLAASGFAGAPPAPVGGQLR